jgi:predicted dehydrogenase
MKKYKALIIGAGSIGALKPDNFDSPESKQIYTHGHACYSHPLIDLVGIIDKDTEKSVKAGTKWNTNSFDSIKQAYEYTNYQNKKPDIVIVAVNTDQHYDIIHQLIPYKPKVIICEKPFCTDLEQAQKISDMCKQAGIGLVINYLRTFVPELKQLSKDLKNEVYGDVYNFTLRYSRGLLREASHAFYWCLQTFGKATPKNMNNIIKDSPTKNDYSAHISFKTDVCKDITFIPIGSAYSTYNADIYTEKGRIELLNNWKTIRFHENVKSTYGDYSATGLMFTDKQTGLDQALSFLLDHVIKNIDNPTIDQTAIEVHKHLKLNTV